MALALIQGAVSTRRAQEVLSEARDCRGEIGIVRTALDDRLSLNERLIFPIQKEARLDRDRAMDTECLILHIREYKGTHFSPGIRVQFEAALYAIGCGGIASCSRPETPVGRLSFSRLEGEIPAQLS